MQLINYFQNFITLCEAYTNAIAFDNAGYGNVFVNGLPKQSTHLSTTSTSFPNRKREEEALYKEIHLYR